MLELYVLLGTILLHVLLGVGVVCIVGYSLPCLLLVPRRGCHSHEIHCLLAVDSGLRSKKH